MNYWNLQGEMKNGHYDYLVVGAGLTGSVLARQLSNAGAKCLVIEKRNHIGGNIYDEEVEGVRVHRYGPHIFHTNSKRIWKYINRFAEWMPYEHRIKAIFQDTVYSFPPNLMTYQQLGIGVDDPSLSKVLYEVFFCGYSKKQWGRPAESVPSSIIKRIPIRYDYDDRYFSDRYQALPVGGYTSFVQRILEGVDIELGIDYLSNRQELEKLAARIIYTGAIDALYDHKYGRLEYRSLRFETEIIDQSYYHGSPTLNYTDTHPEYTRSHNWRYFGWQESKANIITWEYPISHDETNDPYYPINDECNNTLYKQYKMAADGDGIVIAGRLGRYQYYDMHQAMGAALHLAEVLLS